MTIQEDHKADLRILEDLHESAPGRFVATIIVALVVYKTAGPMTLLAWSLGIILNEAIEILVYERACVRREDPSRWRHLMEANFIWGGLTFGAASLIIWIDGGLYDLIYAFILLIGSLLHTVIYFSHSRRLLVMMGAPAAGYLALMPFVILYRNWEDMNWMDAAPMILGVAMFIFYFIVASLENSRATQQLHAAVRDARRAKREAEAADQTKSIFLANTSHEIRTPLNGVMGMAQALARSDLTPDQRHQVDAILSSGKVLTGVLNDVLDLSKIEAGRMEVHPLPTDVRELFSHQATMWRVQAAEKGLAFSMTIDDSVPPRMQLDPVRVRQCVGNLVSNALKFTETGSVSLVISCQEEEGSTRSVTVVVEDTGIGIEPDQLGAIFSPFMQADSSITRRYGGTGLGLSVTRQIAHLMGGDVRAERRPEGGSRFTLRFQAEAIAEDAEVSRITPKGRDLREIDRRLRVLVVDDTPTNRMLIRVLLKGYAARVDEAENGVEALKKLEEEEFDLVLLDIHMPVMDGRETLRRIREAGNDVKVIALTADANPGDRDAYLKLGMDGYTPKPIDQRMLAAEILDVTGDLDLSDDPKSRLAV